MTTKSTKPWYKSKTFWFNILSTALVIAAMPEFANVLPSSMAPWLALGVALGNMVLRSITNTGVTMK